MRKQADVAVIIPVYNAAETLAATLDSVANQTVQPKTIYCIDDGSSDESFKILESYNGKVGDIPLVVRQQQNAGAGAARNHAIRLAQTTYVAFLDADDEWLPEKLEKSLKIMAEQNATFVAHDMLVIKPSGKEKYLDCVRNFKRRKRPQVTLFFRNFIGISTVVMEKAPLIAAGGFDCNNRYSLDFECWNAVLRQPGTSFYVFNEALTRYKISPGGLTSNVVARLKDREDYIRRYARDIAPQTSMSLFHVTGRALLFISYEALSGALKRKDFIAMTKIYLHMPVGWAKTFYHALFKPSYIRPDFIERRRGR